MMGALAFITRIATAIGGKGGAKEKKRSTLRTVAVVFGMVREFKIDSIDRIERAVVGEVEAESREAQADADFRVAEAAEKQAMAAYKLAEADQVAAKAHSVRQDSETKRMKATADAVLKLANAISKIRQAGGSVTILEREMAKLLQAGTVEFPEDRLITDAVRDESLTETGE